MSKKKRTYDIIIPVSRALPYFRQCINSILENTRYPYNLVIVDDGSSPIIKEYLRTISSARIITNEKNLGWFKSCNIGIGSTENDVVLLNSHTLVTEGWLEKMDRCAYSSSKIGMVNPLSNNALFLSIPHNSIFNTIPAGFTMESFAALVSELSESRYPSIPTVFDFCLLIKRELFDYIGLFDEKFELGYGEENDFFMRAKRKGYKAVCCDDVFVYHYGKKSFGDSSYREAYRRKPAGKHSQSSQVKHYSSTDRFNNNPLSYLRTKSLAKISEISPGYKDKVSIIMPVYNRQEYLEEAIRSVLRQSYSNFELIIVDDGSTDNSLNIAGEFVEQDKRVTVITLKEHEGIAIARNEGLKRARGGFITQFDSDDVMLPDAIKSRVEFLNSNPDIDLVFGKIHQCINKQGKVIESKYSEYIRYIQYFYGLRKDYNFYEKLKNYEFGIPNVNSTSMLRRDAFFRSGYYEESLKFGMEDTEFFSRVLKGINISFLNEPLLLHRLHSTNISKKIDKNSGEWVIRSCSEESEYRVESEYLMEMQRDYKRDFDRKRANEKVKTLTNKGKNSMKKPEKTRSQENHLQSDLLIGQVAHMAELINRYRLQIKEQHSVIIVKERYIHNVDKIIEGKYQYIINIMAYGFGRRLRKLTSKLTKRESSLGISEKIYTNENYLQADLIKQIEYMTEQIDLLRSKIETQRVAMVAKDQHINSLNRVMETKGQYIFKLVIMLNRIKRYFDDNARKVWRRLRGI